MIPTKIPIKKTIVVTTAKIFGSFNLRLRNSTTGLPIKAITAAMAKYANTERMVYKKYRSSIIPITIPRARRMPLANVLESII